MHTAPTFPNGVLEFACDGGPPVDVGPTPFRTLPDSPGLVLPGDDAEAARVRAAEWNSSLKPFNVFEVFLVDQAATQSLRIERFQEQERSQRHLNAVRASLRWEQDRQKAAILLGATLPKAPEAVSRQLMDTKQGCDWLIGRWNGLARVLGALGDWDKAQTRLALDLLGVPPEFRVGPTPIDLDRDGRLELIRAEVARLEAEKHTTLMELDALERDAAIKGLAPDPDGQLAALGRREQSCSCRLEWARDQLKKGRHELPIPLRPAPAPAPAPAPVPPPPAPAPTRSPRTEDEWNTLALANEARRKAFAARGSQPSPEAGQPEPGALGLVVSKLRELAGSTPRASLQELNHEDAEDTEEILDE